MGLASLASSANVEPPIPSFLGTRLLPNEINIQSRTSVTFMVCILVSECYIQLHSYAPNSLGSRNRFIAPAADLMGLHTAEF